MVSSFEWKFHRSGTGSAGVGEQNNRETPAPSRPGTRPRGYRVADPGDACDPIPDRAKEASKVEPPSYPLPRTWLRHGWIRLPAIRDTDWVHAQFGHN